MSHADSRVPLKSLDTLEWENRIIIVNALDQDAEFLRSQLKERTDEIDDRDIVWFLLSSKDDVRSGKDVRTPWIESNYPKKINPSLHAQLMPLTNQANQQVILIGKDGGIKSRSSSLNLRAFFDQIDAMPMRILEMQNN